MKPLRNQLLVSTTITFVWLFAALPGVADEGEYVATIARKGAVTLTSEVRVDGLTLQPGRYWIQHRAEGSKHFLHFTWITQHSVYFPGVITVKEFPGEVECQVQPLAKEILRTTVYTRKRDEVYQVTRIEIAEERVAHLFNHNFGPSAR